MTENRTSAAVPLHRADLDAWAETMALRLEAARREVTLLGGLLLIPATMLVVLSVMAVLGVAGPWLLLSAVMGLCIGPAVCLGFLAASHAVGRPAMRRLHRRRLVAAGMGPAEARRAWDGAVARLNRHDMLVAGTKGGAVLGDHQTISV